MVTQQKNPLDTQAAVRWLQREYTRRYESNPRYSLRAFAKALELSHAYLSLLLNGKRSLSYAMAEKISQHVCSGPEQRDEFWASVQGKAPVAVEPVVLRQQIDLDTFSLISEWHHYAILSLLEIRGAKYEARWIASRLGISEMQAKISMDRLERLKIVEQDKKGRWRQSTQPIAVENTMSNQATRKFHQTLLAKALESLENDPIRLRDFSSITFAMHPKDVPYAVDRIRNFRRDLCGDLEKRGLPKEVYNLTVQLYPVTRSLSEDEK